MHMNAVRAEEVLRTTPGLTPESIRSLTLTATGDQGLADDAYSEALAAEMRRGR